MAVCGQKKSAGILLDAGRKNQPESSWTPAEKIRNFDYSKSGYFSLN